MLKVVVESAKGIPKKTFGIPDPIATILFKGKSSRGFFPSQEVNFILLRLIY